MLTQVSHASAAGCFYFGVWYVYFILSTLELQAENVKDPAAVVNWEKKWLTILQWQQSSIHIIMVSTQDA